MQSEMRRDGSVDWSALPPPARGLRCVVVVPARNEALLLPRALKAIAQQTGAAGLYEVLVLANNCSDDTAARARAFAATCSSCAIHVTSVAWPKTLAHVGRARRALMDEAVRRLGAAAARDGVVLSTDGDSRVAPDWVATTLAAIDAGADAVGGRIVTDPDPALPVDARRLMRLDDNYRRWRAQLESLADPDPADPWPRHHQHFGASLAVTAAAYAAVGGLPLVRYLEDEALVQALRLHDKSVRHSPDVRVRTSARLDGRAEVGLSWQLRTWADHGAQEATAGMAQPHCPAVPDPAHELRTWRLRRLARDVWRHARAAASAPVAACQRWLDAAVLDNLPEPDWPNAARLARDMRAATSFGAVWVSLEPLLRQQMASALVPMDQALLQLRTLCAQAARPAPPAVTRGRSAVASDRRRGDQVF